MAYAYVLKARWVVVHILLVVSSLQKYWVNGEQQVPCYFIFGDSSADNGNNNALVSTAKANYNPYGIDFPQGATGRFTNGRTYVDAIAGLLGFDNFIQPFASTRSDNDTLRGVNYASGAAGIRGETGQRLGARISMDVQLNNHKTTVSQIVRILGNENAAKGHLNKCIYTVGIGSNDYINNYFLPQFYQTSRQYTPEQYAQVLIQQYSKQLKTLYVDGARKIALFGLSRLGCALRVLATNDRNGSACVEKINSAAQMFNLRLVSLVNQLNAQLPQARFTYVNEYGSGNAGSLIANASCCQVVKGQDLCTPNLKPCPNRDQYIFWDGVHPTQIVNLATAAAAYSGKSPANVYPINISQLAKL